MTRTSKAAKMAKEMLVADRRAKQRRHRARTANKATLIRPETFEIGKHPCNCGASSAQFREAAAAQRQSVGPVARHTCRAADAIDLLLAAILWGLAFACVAFTIALAASLFTHIISK